MFHHNLKGNEHLLTDLATDVENSEITNIAREATRGLLDLLFRLWEQFKTKPTQDLQLFFYPRAQNVFQITLVFVIFIKKKNHTLDPQYSQTLCDRKPSAS